MKLAAKPTFGLVMFCFLISGMAGLVYQVVWARYLALFLGHTSYAVVAVLVAFMGGLALGNAWVGAKADRTQSPLALYAWLEIGIGVYATVFPAYFGLCHAAFISLARHFEPGAAPVMLLKFLFSLAAVLLPTTLMGATFPVLARFVTNSLSELRESVAALYFINSCGAVLGCLFADFWWIPSVGLELTVFAGAALNFGAGFVALITSRVLAGRPTIVPPKPQESMKEEAFTTAELRMAVAGIGLSGFVAMVYEVAWTRALALALGGTTHAFSIMLATFISGIAVGAWLVYRSRRKVRCLEAFAWAELVLAITVLASMMFYAEVPYWFLRGASLLSRTPASYPIYELWQAIICFGVMFVPAACLGLTLPLVSRIATAEIARTGRSVGRVFAVNTLGTVAGAVSAGLWLMPWFGLARTFAFGIVINASIGLAIIFRRRLMVGTVVGALAAAFCLVLAIGGLFNDQWERTFSAGLWRSAQAPATRQEFQESARSGRVLYYKDGPGATVTVISKPYGDKEVLSLKVNGKTDAASAVDVTTQLLLGHIPMLLHPASRDALVVGMGSGMTADAVARHSSIQHVDVVEISPEVVQAARLFGPYNRRFWENPKISVTIEDAKSFLKITRRTYDAIISEPSNPWMSGVAGVFSREYYEDCRDRLKPNGIMAQWVQAYEVSDELLNTVLRTFSTAFPYLSIWEVSPADLVLVGSVQPFQVDLEAMRTHFSEPLVSADLRRIDLVSLPALLATEAISEENGAFVAPTQGPTHSDFYPVLDFQAGRDFFLLGRADRWRSLDEKHSPRPTTLLGKYIQKHPLTEEDFRALARFYLACGLPNSNLFETMLLRWLRENPHTVLPIELMGQTPYPGGDSELQALELAPVSAFLLELAATNPEPLRQYESYLMQAYRAQRSVFNQPPTSNLEMVLKRLLQTNPSNQRVYKCHLAEIAWDLGDDTACADLARSALDPSIATGGPPNFSIDPKAPQLVLLRRIDTLWRSGKLADAFDLCLVAKRLRLIGTDPQLDMLDRKIEAYAARNK